MCKGLATLPATCLKSAKDIKHKISFLLQKPEAPPADQKQPNEKNSKSVPAADEVEKWRTSFSHVMKSEAGRAVFSNFLKSEFSEENMDFWVACEDYKKTGASMLETRAKQIYQQYVEADAPNEVNLDAVTREETREKVENADPSCFDDAQRMIYKLMEKDSYRRFLISKLIQDLFQKQTAGPQTKKSHGYAASRQALAGGA